MGLFSPIGGSNNRKVTGHEYERKGISGIRNRIMNQLSGSWGEKKKKMAELDSALHPSFDHGGKTTRDDGIDRDEAKSTFSMLRKNDPHLSLNKHDIDVAEKEIEKGM